jgi:hypothetical protein
MSVNCREQKNNQLNALAPFYLLRRELAAKSVTLPQKNVGEPGSHGDSLDFIAQRVCQLKRQLQMDGNRQQTVVNCKSIQGVTDGLMFTAVGDVEWSPQRTKSLNS